MTEQLIILWCYIEGQPNCFRVSVSISPSCIVDELVKQIYDQHVKFIVECSYASLTLTKVNVALDVVYGDIDRDRARQYKLDANDRRRLRPDEKIFEVWPEPPPVNHLQVFVSIPGTKAKRNTTPSEFKLDIEAIDEKIKKELDVIRGMIKAFLRNPELRTWEPPMFASPSNQKFITDLRIPCYQNGNPSLLFHNLHVCDHEEEIKMIFGSIEHQFICNTSGSGKTRRMLEGFMKYWGFYLVARPDSTGVGVGDLHSVLNELPLYSQWVSDLTMVDRGERAVQQAVNRLIVSRQLRKVLAARIVVFRLFLQLVIEVDGKLEEKHKRIWLLFQLSDKAVPFSEDRHPFVRMIGCLGRASDEALDELVKRLNIIGHEFLSNSRVVLGLDEAQVASRMYPHSFISSDNPDTFRSVIREMVEVFTKFPIKLVVSGTDLSAVEVENAMTSGVGKAAPVHVFHELGMFDTWPKLKSFVERYIPVSILESKSGKFLQQRMREYLQGRYRFSVSYVEYLLKNGLESPHKLFNKYIKDYIGCLPGDTGESFASTEHDLRIQVKMVGFEWGRLKLDKVAITEAVRVVQSHLLKGEKPTYGPVTDRLVEYGIAHLRVEREEYKGQIDEPLAFLSIMRWLQDQDHVKIQANLRTRLGHDPAARGGAFEEVGILYLLRELRNRVCLTSVFDFRCTPSWADEMAHIIARLDNVHVDVPGLSVVQSAKNIEEVIDWVNNDTASAILIPGYQFGPDVMARCRPSPSNETVFLMGRFKSYTDGNIDTLAAKTTVEALNSLHPDHWFKQAPSHQRQKLIDVMEKQHVLRFVGGYPLPPNLNSGAASVKQAIDSIKALGANVALASLRLDKLRAHFISEGEAMNVLIPMDDALDRKRKASGINNRY